MIMIVYEMQETPQPPTAFSDSLASPCSNQFRKLPRGLQYNFAERKLLLGLGLEYS